MAAIPCHNNFLPLERLQYLFLILAPKGNKWQNLNKRRSLEMKTIPLGSSLTFFPFISNLGLCILAVIIVIFHHFICTVNLFWCPCRVIFQRVMLSMLMVIRNILALITYICRYINFSCWYFIWCLCFGINSEDRLLIVKFLEWFYPMFLVAWKSFLDKDVIVVTSIKRAALIQKLCSFPSVSELERFDCNNINLSNLVAGSRLFSAADLMWHAQGILQQSQLSSSFTFWRISIIHVSQTFYPTWLPCLHYNRIRCVSRGSC